MPASIFEDQRYEFQYRGKDYVLTEPPESANVEYQTVQFTKAAESVSVGVDDKGNPDLTSLKNLKLKLDAGDSLRAKAILVGGSVFEKNGDGYHSSPVGKDVVGGWNSRLVKFLYDKAQEFQRMDTDPKN